MFSEHGTVLCSRSTQQTLAEQSQEPGCQPRGWVNESNQSAPPSSTSVTRRAGYGSATKAQIWKILVSRRAGLNPCQARDRIARGPKRQYHEFESSTVGVWEHV